jgi:acylaminoacyl-peptidase
MKYPELLSLRRCSHLSVSPGGGRCAFLVHTPSEAENSYVGRVYVSAFTGDSAPVGTEGVTGLAWIDEHTLLISRANCGGTALSKLSVMGGAEKPFATVPFAAAVDGFLGGEALLSARRPMTEEKAREDGSWTVLDELPIWVDGVGYRSKIRRRLFLCGSDGQMRCISPEEMDVHLVSADGSRVAYAGYTPGVLDGTADEIRCWDGADRLVCKDAGEIQQIALGVGTVFFAVLSPDKEAGAAPVLMQVSAAGGTPSMLYASELTVGSYIVSDAGSPGKVFAVSGDTLYFAATEKGATQLYSLVPGGKPQRLTDAAGSIDQLDVRAGRIVFAGLRGANCHEVYCLADGEQQLSSLHREGSVPYRPIAPIQHQTVQGWALREIAEDRTRPAVVFLHDGPQQAFGEVYHFGMQLLAQHGYEVLFANLPGSVGYGSRFAELGGRWGGEDCDALLAFIDAALAECPEIDPSRLAVMGTGYGAYLAAIAVGSTNRFAAAICDGVISNCISMEATSDHGAVFAAKQIKASSYANPEELWRRSPLSRIASMKTPTLILHGEDDRSSHLSQGQMLFTALKVQGVPVRMGIFPGESHQLASTGTPAARDRYYQEVLRWLDMYL